MELRINRSRPVKQFLPNVFLIKPKIQIDKFKKNGNGTDLKKKTILCSYSLLNKNILHLLVSKMKVDCDFGDVFMCGYSSFTPTQSFFSRANGDVGQFRYKAEFIPGMPAFLKQMIII